MTLSALSRSRLATLAFLGALTCSPNLIHAQAEAKKASGISIGTEQELIKIETGFFEAWKTKDEGYFKTHIAENGVFWGEYGTFSRDEQLQAQRDSAKSCNLGGYGLSEFGVLPLTTGAYLLTYKADQYATCNGERVPIHMNGSSIYVLKGGKWLAIYRAEVPLQSRNE